MQGYYSLNRYLQVRFGEKVYRLLLDPGTGCPNRDGKISTEGCSFCKSGNTEFSESCRGDVVNRIGKAKERIASKTTAKRFIAYFGVGSATYGKCKDLEALYREALSLPEIAAISLGTRPDCLTNEILQMLEKLNRIKPVWVELGLQTAHDKTAERINRGYKTEVFEKALYALKEKQLTVIPHLILGLPGETREDMLDSAEYIAGLPIDGVKLHMLSILKGTPLEKEYTEAPWKLMEIGEYASLLYSIISLLPENVVIHRFTGDGAKKDLIAPLWTADKKYVLNTINQYFTENHLCQGAGRSLQRK